MNKTQFKNNFGKYFQQIIGAEITSVRTNKVDTIEIDYSKNHRKNTLQIKSDISMSSEQVLNFEFILNKIKNPSEMEEIFQTMNTLNDISLYIAQDSFCKEQALELRYNNSDYFYILIYTNMVESSLEFFEEKLTAEKFKKVVF